MKTKKFSEDQKKAQAAWSKVLAARELERYAFSMYQKVRLNREDLEEEFRSSIQKIVFEPN